MFRQTLIAAAVAAGSMMGLGSVAQAVPAVVYTGPAYVVQAAPPPPLYEAAPAARAGYIWTPGYYEWRGDRYVWTSGRWLETRQGYAWQQPRWQQRGDGSWYLVGGQWVRGDNMATY